jgi:hypothetical protein
MNYIGKVSALKFFFFLGPNWIWATLFRQLYMPYSYFIFFKKLQEIYKPHW